MTNTWLCNTEITSVQEIGIGKTAINLKNCMLTTPISYQLEGIPIRLLTIKQKKFGVLKLSKTK